MPVGAFVLLETRAFDPMHAELRRERGTALPTARSRHGGDDGSTPTAVGATAVHSRCCSSGFANAECRSPAFPRGFPLRPVNPVSTGDPRPLRLGFAKGRWRINDRVYDMDATPIVVARAAIETWLIRNYHSSMPHAMHLHGFEFRVLERETSPDQFAPLAVDQRGRLATDLGWKDTVLVWPGESVRIAIDFRHPFAGEQIYLFHCHNLEHEDGGMMLRVKVG